MSGKGKVQVSAGKGRARRGGGDAAKVSAAKAGAARRKASEAEPEPISWWKAFYRVVRWIPVGRVSTYGVVAALAGHPRSARHVGFALAALKETGANADVPWHRVLASRPRNRAAVTIRDPIGGALQRMLLEAEDVAFDDKGNVSLDQFGWFGKKPAKKPAGRAPQRAPAAKGRRTERVKGGRARGRG